MLMGDTEHPTSNIQHPTSNGPDKPPPGKSRKQKVENRNRSGGPRKSHSSHPQATLRPPSGHLVANR